MNSQKVVDLAINAIYASAELSTPLLLTALVVGLLVSIFQAATQINEATLSFLPKVAAMILVLALISPWMIQRMKDYTTNLYAQIPEVTRSR
jgi:flagellar biosynthetic protein FliQ